MDHRPQAQTVAAYALVVVLVVLTTVWGAFLTPLRIGGHLVPVSLLIVGAANVGLGRAAGRLLGRWGVAGTGLLWTVVALTLGSRRPEGDLIIANGWVGVSYLLLGVVTAAVAFGLTPSARDRLQRRPVVSAAAPSGIPLSEADRIA